MATIAISASSQRACSSNHVNKRKKHPQVEPFYPLGTKQVMKAVNLDMVAPSGINLVEQDKTLASQINKTRDPTEKLSGSKFKDERWKNGTWDLNMFVRNGRMDWDGVIVAEARRRKFLELHPEARTNQEPVQFRSSIIPWWAWLMRTYLPQAELLNGLDIVGQTGNFICKVGVFVTVIGVILLRKTQDFENLKKLADEVTYYDKQWQASWKDQNESSVEKSQKL